MFLKENFVNRLNELLASTHTSKQSLADSINVKRQAVSQFANGANLPSIETLVAIANHLDVSIDYLLCQTDKPERNK